jgi:hypothetical protein
MHSAMWLRLSAGLTLFLAAGHTFGAVLAAPSHGPEEVALREAMRRFRVTALLVGTAAVMWFLAPVVRQSQGRTRPVIAALAAGYAAVTAISTAYFVTAPIVVAAVITACLIVATLQARDGAGSGH